MLQLQQLPTAAILFVVAGIVLAIGADITKSVADDVNGTSTTASAAGYNATEGLGELSSWLPTIALVVAAGLILGIVVGAFMYFSSEQGKGA